MDKTEQKIQTLEQTTEVVRMTCKELADLLSKERQWTLKEGQTLVLERMETGDLISLVEETEPMKRLGTLVEIMRRYGLELRFEGSLHLGPFTLADHSWSLTPGASRSLTIHSTPTTLRRSLQDVVSFLSKLPTGQALVLKPFQTFFLEDLPSKAMLDYYDYCQEETGAEPRETKQDELFTENCSLLQEKKLTLKIYGMNAKQIDRVIDPQAGGILFTPVASEETPQPRLVIVLLDQQG